MKARADRGCLNPDCLNPDAWTKCWECGWEYEGDPGSTTDSTPEARDRAIQPIPDKPGHVAVTLPWDMLVSANIRNGLDRAKWKEYTNARDSAHVWASGQVKHKPRFREAECTIHVRFYVPDARRRDPGNYMKMIEDALEGVTYANDHQLVGGSWEKVAMDRDNPRAEITVTSASSSHGGTAA